MDIDSFKELMRSYGSQIDIEFNEEQLNKFYKYMQLLLEWNEKINLQLLLNQRRLF